MHAINMNRQGTLLSEAAMTNTIGIDLSESDALDIQHGVIGVTLPREQHLNVVEMVNIEVPQTSDLDEKDQDDVSSIHIEDMLNKIASVDTKLLQSISDIIMNVEADKKVNKCT